MSHRALIAALLTFVATGCSQQDKKPRLPEQAVVGSWASDTLSSPDGTTRVYRLRMDARGMAEFVSSIAGRPTLTERGTWDGADSLVRVVVRGEGTASRPTSLLLAMRGKAVLGLVRYDSATWGADGFRLRRQRENAAADLR